MSARASKINVTLFCPRVGLDGELCLTEVRFTPGTKRIITWLNGRPVKSLVRRLSNYWGRDAWQLFAACWVDARKHCEANGGTVANWDKRRVS